MGATLKYCATCGSELGQGGKCSKCETDSKNRSSRRVVVTQGDWIALMMRFFLLTTAISTFLYVLRWPLTLASDPRSLGVEDNVYFLMLTVALFGTVALAVTVRSSVGLVSGFLLAGFGLWVWPEFLFYLLAHDTYGLPNYTPGAFDNLVSVVTTLSGPLPEVIISIGFFLLSLAHLPVAFLGFFSIAQESISRNLSNRTRQVEKVRQESALAIGAFIAAFLAPIAGLILSLIGVSKWNDFDSRSRGLLVASLSISTLVTLIGGLMLANLLIGLFGTLASGTLF